MRAEDVRPGTGVTKISGEGRGPLTESEQALLRAQHKNREADGVTPSQFEARNLRALAVDSRMKRPKFGQAPWIKDPTGQG